MSPKQQRAALQAAIDQHITSDPKLQPLALAFFEQLEEEAAAGDPSSLGTAAAHGVKSPLGNTGDKLTVGLDWLTVTFPGAVLRHVRELISDLLGNAEDRAYGNRFYGASCGWASGALLFWSESRGECCLSLNGDSLSFLSADQQQKLCVSLAKFGARASRMDPRLDVPRSRLPMAIVHEAAEAGNVCGYRRYDPRRPRKSMASKDLAGDSAYFGRRGKDGSGRFFRAYDKFLETGGEIDATRFECEMSGAVAALAFQQLSAAKDTFEFQKIVGELLGGTIDFRDRSRAHGHRDRMPRLQFWQEILDEIGRAALSIHRPQPPLQRSLEHMSYQYCTHLWLLHELSESMGYEGDEVCRRFTTSMLAKGRKRGALRGISASRQLGIDLSKLCDVVPPQAFIEISDEEILADLAEIERERKARKQIERERHMERRRNEEEEAAAELPINAELVRLGFASPSNPWDDFLPQD